MKKLLIAVFVILSCTACFGQSGFQEITPGVSSRREVVKVLGQPMRSINTTVFEYAPPAGIARVEVEYRAGSDIVERIEVHFLRPVSRSALINKFNLPQQAESTNTNAAGMLMEYFGGSSLLVLTYAAADANSGVNSIGYYSRELFDNTSAKAGGKRQNPTTQSRTSQSGSGTVGLGDINLPEYMRPPAESTSVSVDRTGPTSTSGGTSSSAGSSEAKRTTTTTRSSPSSGGRSSATVTTPPGDGHENHPSTHPGAISDNNADAAEMELILSASELRRFVDMYQFIQPSGPGVKPAEIRLVAGKLRLTMGAVTYTLLPIFGDGFVVGDQGESVVFGFKAAGERGVRVYFTIVEDKLRNLFIVEDQRQPKRFSVAVPRP